MKRLIILMLLIASSTIISAQKAKEAEYKRKHTATAKVTYSCPMHPEVTSTKPGKCPKCNSDLGPLKKGANENGGYENLYLLYASRCNKYQTR